jgi:hypothetical protein
MGAGLPTEKDGLPIEPGSLAKGVYRKMRSSLEEALSEISDREGLTDQELKMQTMRLQTVTDTLPQEVSDHIRRVQLTIFAISTRFLINERLVSVQNVQGSHGGSTGRRGCGRQRFRHRRTRA